jgi:hypothetical protein
VVRSDQRSLKYLWSQKISTTAQQKWLYKLMGFNFSIEYKKGKENIVADALSRRDDQHTHTRLPPVMEEDKQNEGTMVAISCPTPKWLDVIKDEINNTRELQELAKKIEDGEALGP